MRKKYVIVFFVKNSLTEPFLKKMRYSPIRIGINILNKTQRMGVLIPSTKRIAININTSDATNNGILYFILSLKEAIAHNNIINDDNIANTNDSTSKLL